MERFRVLEAQHPEQPGAQCPPSEVWFDLAGGVAREDANNLLRHSAGCDYCGLLLRDALAVLSEEISKEEARQILTLASATPEWQRTLSEQLSGLHEREPEPHHAARSRAWWMPSSVIQLTASAAVVAVLVAAGTWAVWYRSETRSASQLIAQAYTEKRTIEMRIGGAPWTPLRHERGGNAEADRMSRPALLKAEGEIAGHLKAAPDDVTWLEASGRANLLEEGGEEQALAVLIRAHEIAPNNRSVMVDLASAYVLRAETAHRPQDFGTAIDLLGKTLSADPKDETAQFNYAIALDKLGLKKQAVDAWQEYLRLHPASTWDGEARERLEQVRQEIQDHDRRSSAPLEPAEVVAAAFSEQNPEKIDRIDGRAEEYLTIAVQHWLPEWAEGRTPRARADLETALFGLAELARQRHGDRWLEEMLAADRNSPVVREAFRELATSEEGIAASTNHSESEARRAEALFRQAGVQPGVLRSQVDLAMVYQLQHDWRRCEALAAQATAAGGADRWPWVDVQSHLELGICSDAADLRSVRLEQTAQEIAEVHAYPILASRAQDFEAASYLISGDTNHAWTISADGLNRFWKGSYPELRGYNLLTKFHDLAEMQRQWSLEVAVLQEAVPMIASHPNIAMRAFEQTRLGEAQLDSGNTQGAEQAFRDAEQMFDQTPAGARRSALMAEGEVGLARAELQQGRPGEAERRLDAVRPAVIRVGDDDLLRWFYGTSGIAALQSGDFAVAHTDLAAGIRLAEQGLRISDTEAARWEWRHGNEPIYRAIVELELRSDPAAALEWWEWFKGASLRRGHPEATSSETDPTVRTAALHLPDDRGGNAAVVSYAALGNRVAVWVWDIHGIHQVWLPASVDALNPIIENLAEHCSDPASRQQTIRTEAVELYRQLIAPIEKSIAYHDRLIVEPDGILRKVPFELLVNPAGNYLGDQFAVSISPGIEYLDESRKWTGVMATSAASVVGNGQTSGWAPLPETDEEARAVAGMFRGAHLVLSSDDSPGSVAAEMARAQVFHFSGHAFSDVRSSGLITGRGELLDALRLPESLPIRSRLVVLSACDTAQGSSGYFDDEDSLVRRLMQAGVPEVVASRWMVDSSATLALMRSFYGQLLSGKPVSVALALASRDLRSRPEYSHPFYWAGFSVYGRG